MSDPLSGKNIVLGVCGSAACYKAVDLASKLTQRGASVNVIMTDAAQKFISPLYFNAITRNKVVSDIFSPTYDTGMDHIAISKNADIFVVAPATINKIAHIANGFANDALTDALMASNCPVILAPASDAHMYQKPSNQENIQKLMQRGFVIAGPEFGMMASGLKGIGRMIEIPDLISSITMTLGKNLRLAGLNILVSAGGLKEKIDPVRIITNKSSGKMGYAIAESARDNGASVTLVSASTSLKAPFGVQLISVSNSDEMREVLLAESESADVLIMAAAVSDWKPLNSATEKIKKEDRKSWNLELVKTQDILSSINKKNLFKIGFAAETGNLKENALKKLRNKKLDMIVANDVTEPNAGFGHDTNKISIIDTNENVKDYPLMSKYDAASKILDSMVNVLGK